jgi:hypothetical protein
MISASACFWGQRVDPRFGPRFGQRFGIMHRAAPAAYDDDRAARKARHTLQPTRLALSGSDSGWGRSNVRRQDAIESRSPLLGTPVASPCGFEPTRFRLVWRREATLTLTASDEPGGWRPGNGDLEGRPIDLVEPRHRSP